MTIPIAGVGIRSSDGVDVAVVGVLVGSGNSVGVTAVVAVGSFVVGGLGPPQAIARAINTASTPARVRAVFKVSPLNIGEAEGRLCACLCPRSNIDYLCGVANTKKRWHHLCYRIQPALGDECFVGLVTLALRAGVNPTEIIQHLIRDQGRAVLGQRHTGAYTRTDHHPEPYWRPDAGRPLR